MHVKTSESRKHGSLGALTFSFTSPDSRLSASFPSTFFSIILYTVFWQISFLKHNSNHSTIQNNHSKQSLNSSAEYVRFYPYHYISKISFLSYLPLLRAHVLWFTKLDCSTVLQMCYFATWNHAHSFSLASVNTNNHSELIPNVASFIKIFPTRIIAQPTKELLLLNYDLYYYCYIVGHLTHLTIFYFWVIGLIDKNGLVTEDRDKLTLPVRCQVVPLSCG